MNVDNREMTDPKVHTEGRSILECPCVPCREQRVTYYATLAEQGIPLFPDTEDQG